MRVQHSQDLDFYKKADLLGDNTDLFDAESVEMIEAFYKIHLRRTKGVHALAHVELTSCF